MRKTICVFCSSSVLNDEEIIEAANDFAKQIALSGYKMLYGGTSCGLMKSIADSYKSHKGVELIGVLPEGMIQQGRAHPLLDEQIKVQSMSERKKIMLEKSDVIVALPGGIGTLDEFFDLLVQRQLGYHNKPMYLINIKNFYQPLLKLIEEGKLQNTISTQTTTLYEVITSFKELDV